MRRSLVRGLASAVVLIPSACSVVLPFDSYTAGNRDGDAGPVDGAITGDDDATDPCGDVQTSAAHCGSCGHSCLGDRCIGGQCVASPITTTRPGGYGIDVDAQNVYWSVSFGGNTGGRLLRIGKDAIGGEGVVLVETPQPRFEPRDVKVDGSYVAVLDSAPGNGTAVVYRVAASGGGVAEIGPGCALDGVSGLAVATTDIYFASARVSGNGLYRAAKSGNDCTATVGDGWPGLQQIALDGTTVYLTQPDASHPPEGSLFALPVGASTPTALAPATVTGAWGVLPDGDALLVTTTQGAVLRVAKDGSTTEALSSEVEALPRGLAADATHVYWANSGSGEIVSHDRRSGARRVIATGQTGVQLLAADASRLYWTTSTHVMRLAK